MCISIRVDFVMAKDLTRALVMIKERMFMALLGRAIYGELRSRFIAGVLRSINTVNKQMCIIVIFATLHVYCLCHCYIPKTAALLLICSSHLSTGAKARGTPSTFFLCIEEVFRKPWWNGGPQRFRHRYLCVCVFIYRYMYLILFVYESIWLVPPTRVKT